MEFFVKKNSGRLCTTPCALPPTMDLLILHKVLHKRSYDSMIMIIVIVIKVKIKVIMTVIIMITVI